MDLNVPCTCTGWVRLQGRGFSEGIQSFLGAATSDEKIINLIQVGGAQQVLLEVKVAEVNRTVGKTLDSQFLSIYDGGSVKIGLSRGWGKKTDFDFTNPNSLTNNLPSTGISSLIDYGNFSAALFLQMAEDNGMAKILAEPNLTTLSGQEAEFISGGSFFITSPSTANNPSPPQEVKYGVQLKFIPFVMDSGVISLKVNVSVSEPGPPTLSGGAANTSLLARGAIATVEVPSGQVIAIAGLLNEKARNSTNEFPGLGDIPILGSLFRGQSFTKEQTELIIFVTPRLASPYSPEFAKLPAGDFVEPNNIEFYLMGKVQGQGKNYSNSGKPNDYNKSQLGPDKQGSEGPFGHDL